MCENNRFNANTPDFRTIAAKKIANLFPEVMSDGQIDFDALREALSPDLEESDNNEKYGFSWSGKRNAKREADSPSQSTTLVPNKEKSVDWDNTKNIYIEGDNLEVLKLMQRAYNEKIKVIYLDPPYNTGNDFVYKDNYHNSYQNYLRETGQVDDAGKPNTTNKESNGRFHTDWLNMMYPRLKLARNLLKENGSIFISIDNNEIKNLLNLMDEIFGERNRLGIVSNTNNPKGRSDDKFIATAHEYIVVYAKNINLTDWYGFRPTEKVTKRYNKKDEDGNRYREIDLRKTGEKDLKEDRPKMFYFFYYNQKTGDFFPDNNEKEMPGYIKIKPQREDGRDGRWRWGIDTAKQNIDKIFPKFMPTRKIWGVMEKDYLKDKKLIKPTSSWTFKDVNSERGTEKFTDLGFKKEDFEKPKPVGTIQRCITLGMGKSNDIILDLFAGSGTTAQAVMDLNAQDHGSRRYILVQLPERTKKESAAFKDGYKTIPQISEKRIRNAAHLIKKEQSNVEMDLGFRVYELKPTTIKHWDERPENFERQLNLLNSSFTDSSTNDERAREIALKSGIDLNTSPSVNKNIYHYLSDDREVFIILGNYSDTLLDQLNAQRKLPNARVIIREMNNGSEVKFNIMELLKQNQQQNDHFSLEWI